jgi:hypothetical protein
MAKKGLGNGFKGRAATRKAKEAFLEVGVSVLMSLPDEENLPKVGPQ